MLEPARQCLCAAKEPTIGSRAGACRPEPERIPFMRRALFSVMVLSAAVWSSRPMAQTPSTVVLKPTATTQTAAAGRLIEITASDKDGKYMFTPSTIDAKAGEQLRVRLKALSTMKMPKMAMSHNFILLAKGASPVTFTNEGAVAGFPTNFIAADRKKEVLDQTALQ